MGFTIKEGAGVEPAELHQMGKGDWFYMNPLGIQYLCLLADSGEDVRLVVSSCGVVWDSLPGAQEVIPVNVTAEVTIK